MACAAWRFQPYGSCSPQECVIDVVVIRDGEWRLDEAGVPAARTFVDAGFATRDHVFRLVAPSLLEVDTRTVFRDDRAPQHIVQQDRPDATSSARGALSGELAGTTRLRLDGSRELGTMSGTFGQEGATVTGVLIADAGVVANAGDRPPPLVVAETVM